MSGTTASLSGRFKLFLLPVPLGLAVACSFNPTLKTPAVAPPIVAKQHVLSGDAGDPLVKAALEDYRSDAGVRELIHAVRVNCPEPLTAGNRVDVLVDGPQTYAAIEPAIEAARHHVHLETFIFGAKDIGQHLSDLLIRKRKEGIEVRVLYDSIGSMDTPKEFFENLRANGVEVREFRPINPIKNPKIWEIQNRDHRKIVVVDGKIGFTGGLNIDSTYSSASTSRPGPERGIKDGWRDTHIRVEGQAVKQLQHLFLQSWAKAGEPLPARENSAYFPAIRSPGERLVTIVGNDSDSDDRSLYGSYLAAFSQASKRLWITHAYFAPNQELLDAMMKAAQRGVDVRLIVPAFTDSNIVLNATQATFTPLLKSGVRIYELKDALLHAKSVVIDGTVSIVGSANLDMRSFVHNDEVNAIVIDRELGKKMEEIFTKDQRASRAVELKSWEQRSVWRRMKELTVKLFSYVL